MSYEEALDEAFEAICRLAAELKNENTDLKDQVAFLKTLQSQSEESLQQVVHNLEEEVDQLTQQLEFREEQLRDIQKSIKNSPALSDDSLTDRPLNLDKIDCEGCSGERDICYPPYPPDIGSY